MYTIKDVAKRANVSVATASRALRKKGYLSEKTLEKVNNAAKELGYIPDMNARQLRRGNSNLIGIIVSDIGNYFYNLMLSKIEKTLKQNECAMLLSYSLENPEEERKSFMALIAARVSVIIFTPVCSKNHDLIEKAKENDIRLIQLYRKVYDDVDAFCFDDTTGAYIATKHLIEKGCKSPMLIEVNYENMGNTAVKQSRTEGYLKCLDEYDIKNPLIFGHCLIGNMTEELSEFIVKNKPDGIIAGTNTFGIEALTVCKKLNLKIPEDIKIVVFDDVDWLDYNEITTIRQPINYMTEKLCDSLLNKAEKEINADSEVIFEKYVPEIVIRSSSENI